MKTQEQLLVLDERRTHLKSMEKKLLEGFEQSVLEENWETAARNMNRLHNVQRLRQIVEQSVWEDE